MAGGVMSPPRCASSCCAIWVIERMEAGTGAAGGGAGKGCAMGAVVDSARARIASVAAIAVTLRIISARFTGAGDDEEIVGTIATAGIGEDGEGGEGGVPIGSPPAGGVAGGGSPGMMGGKLAAIGSTTAMTDCTVWSTGVTLVVAGAMIGAIGAATVWIVVVTGETMDATACVTGAPPVVTDWATVRTGGAMALTTGITGCATDVTTGGAATAAD